MNKKVAKMLEIRLDIGRNIVDQEDQAQREKMRSQRREENKYQSVTGIEDNYKKEERVVYVTGFDKGLPFLDLENYMRKYGDIVHVIRHQDEKGRSKGWVFVEYKTAEDAGKAIMDSGRANIMGRKLQINYKISKVKVLEDHDCWFCIDNPKIE